MKIKLLMLALLLLTLPPTVEAQSVDKVTVAEFRKDHQTLPTSYGTAYTLGVTQGAMIVLSAFLVCPYDLSVGELRAYLLFTADPTLTIQTALLQRYVKDGCEFRPSVTGKARI